MPLNVDYKNPMLQYKNEIWLPIDWTKVDGASYDWFYKKNNFWYDTFIQKPNL